MHIAIAYHKLREVAASGIGHQNKKPGNHELCLLLHKMSDPEVFCYFDGRHDEWLGAIIQFKRSDRKVISLYGTQATIWKDLKRLSIQIDPHSKT
jgi:hypothetical protein